MAAQWYVLKGEKKLGPFSSRQLKQLAEQGKVSPHDKILKGESSRPQPAGRIGGLFDQSSESSDQPVQVREIATDTSSTGPPPLRKARNNSAGLATVGLILFAVVTVGFGVMWLNSHDTPTAESGVASISDPQPATVELPETKQQKPETDPPPAVVAQPETIKQKPDEFARFKEQVRSAASRLQDQAASAPKETDQRRLNVEGFDGVEDGILRAIHAHRDLIDFLLVAAVAEMGKPGTGKELSDMHSNMTLNQLVFAKIAISDGNGKDFQGRLAMQVAFEFLLSQESNFERQRQNQLNRKLDKARLLKIYQGFKRDWLVKAQEQQRRMLAENDGRLQLLDKDGFTTADPSPEAASEAEAKSVSSQEDFGKWATSRFDPLFQKTELSIFRENSPKAELITAQIEFNYEQWKYVSVFEDLTGTFIDGHMVGLAFTYKYPADPEQASVNLAKIKAELGAPSTDSKRGPGLEDAISAFRWFDKPRKGYSTLCVLKSLPVPDSKTGAKMYLLHIEMMNVDALRNANSQK